MKDTGKKVILNKKQMAYNIKELLALPNKERRMLATKLWKSLADNNALAKEDEEIIKMLNNRWKLVQTGKAKTYSSDEFWDMIDKHRAKNK